MKVTFKTGSEANYGSTNGELFFASNTKQIMLNGIKYIPKKLSELTNDSGFLTSITKSMVEGVLTGNITSHTHSYLPLSGGTLTGNLTCNGSYITMSGGAGAKGYSGYFNNPKRSDRASYSHILGDGYAYGTNSISIGAAAYAGIRNTDSDSDTYPYLHWQWMNCLQVKEVTDSGDVNCYGAILNNLGGKKDTAKFTVCVDGVCKSYDESKGEDDPTNQFLKFTNTDANYGRVVVFIANTDTLIFGGNTSHPRRTCNLKIGNVILGQGSRIADVASMTINGKTVYRLAIYWWSGALSKNYDITKATTAMVCTKVNNSNYNGASSYASGSSSVASGYSSVASGAYSVASGAYSVASGASSVASGSYSVASGYSSVASDAYSVASGAYSVASGAYSVAKHEGSKVYATRGISGADYQTVLGRYNVETTGAVVVGWGSSDTSRKNIFVLDTNGNATFGSGGSASITAATFNGSLNGTAATATKLVTPRTIKVGSASKSFDGSGDIEFALNSIITQSDTINVGALNVASSTTISEGLTVGGNIGGELANKLSIILGSTTTTYDNTGNKSIEITPSAIGAATASHTHTFASLTSKPTTLSGYGIADAYTKTETNTELGKYLPLSGGALEGALTVPTITATGGIVLGVESINGSLGIKKYNEGFIGFSDILGGINGSVPFEGISLGWGSSPETSANSVRINASTFTYKGNSVLHSGNLGHISSGLSRAVQKDTSGNLFIVAPSLFEQGISNNYPKNLRWSNETEGQLVYDTEETAGSTTTVEVSIPVANGTSKGFLKSTSEVTNVTGYTPCPVVSGTPYYKLDAIELDYTDFLAIGSGSIESHLPITVAVQIGGSLAYLFDYTVNNIPRLLTISAGNFCKYFFWLQQTDDETPIVAYYHCQFNDLWLVIDSPNMEVRISQGSF